MTCVPEGRRGETASPGASAASPHRARDRPGAMEAESCGIVEPADWACLALLAGTGLYLLLSESFWSFLPF